MLKSTVSINKFQLCIDCMYCRTKNLKYFCLFDKFYKDNLCDIMLYTPDDFECENFEGDDMEGD